MGAGKYIGRVGALAVALGVGTAVGSGYGLAWADTTGTSGSSSSESSSSSSSSSTSGSTDTGSNTTSTAGESTTGTGTTTTGTTTTGTTTSSETTSGTHSSDSSTPGTTGTSTSGTQTTTGSTTTVSTGSGSASDPKSTLSAQTVVASGTESRSTSQPTSTAPTPTVDKPTEPVPTKQPTPDPTTVPEPSTQHQTPPENKSPTTSSSNNPQPAATASATVRGLSTPANAGTEPTATSAPATNTRSVIDESALTALPALPSPTATPVSLLSPAVIPPPDATPSVVERTVTSLLSVFGIDVLTGTTPVAPAQSPLLWGLLAWVRRQVAAAIPSVPQVAVTTTSLMTGDPVPAGSPDLAVPAPMAATLDQAAPIATVDLAAPAATPDSTAATDPTAPADPTTLDVVPTVFAAESTTLEEGTPDATEPTDFTAAEPMMMMMAGAEPVLLAAATPTTFAAAVTAPAPAFPAPGAQLSSSTNFISWLTGNYPTTDTLSRFGINGTDVAIIWDNGMVDDPTTPYNEHQLLIAFGDTFGDPNAPGQQWRSNVLLRTSDLVLPDGLSIPNGTVINPADLSTYFGGAALSYVNFAKQIITDPNLGPAVTIIPTAGISVPTPGTMFGVTQYINFMAVQQWGNPGYWTTSYSAIAYSEDNGQNWQVAPSTVRLNQWWTGNQNFQQAAYVRPGDGYVYMYGTPNGRQGNVYLARVPEQSMLDLTKYQYWNGSAPAVPGQPGPAGQWVTGNPAAATAILPIETRLLVGACGALSSSRGPGSTVSEMSVQYNEYLKKYVAMYTDQNNSVVMRTSDRPQGDWSYAKVLLDQQPGGIYAPMMNPWSPSTKGTGSDLYWNLSLFNTYNVMQMRTDLKKVN